jgi:DNA sulfur modification protein DndB
MLMYAEQTMIVIPIPELVRMMDEKRIEIRNVNQLQVRSIKKYMEEAFSKKQVYFPPLIAHTNQQEADLKTLKIRMIDGSKRAVALTQLYKTNKKMLQNSEDHKERIKLDIILSETAIGVQLFSGLTKEEQDQLYIDFNTKGKKVALSKLIEYDSRNAVNQIANQVLQQNPLLRLAGIETEKRAVIRPANKKFLSLSQLRQLVVLFITGKIYMKSPEFDVKLNLQPEEYVELINDWLNELFLLYPHENIGNYEKTILASFPMILAIAYYVNEGMVRSTFAARKQVMKRRMEALRTVNWNVHNREWQQFHGQFRGSQRLYFFNHDKETLLSIVQWFKSRQALV